MNVLRVRLHAFTVMYNMDMNIPRKLASTVMPLIQRDKKKHCIQEIQKGNYGVYTTLQ
jgi:hypothetical protein